MVGEAASVRDTGLGSKLEVPQAELKIHMIIVLSHLVAFAVIISLEGEVFPIRKVPTLEGLKRLRLV